MSVVKNTHAEGGRMVLAFRYAAFTSFDITTAEDRSA